MRPPIPYIIFPKQGMDLIVDHRNVEGSDLQICQWHKLKDWRMIASVVKLVHGNKRKERIAVDHGAHNPMIEQPNLLLSVHCLRNIRVLEFLSLRDVVYLDTLLWRTIF